MSTSKLPWFLLFPSILVCSLLITWKILVAQNFLYGFFYDNTELEEFINYFAPLNKNKPQFQYTSREERIRLFSEVLERVDGSGQPFEDIDFYSVHGRKLGTLLLENEVNHLNLVVKLTRQFKWAAYFFLMIGFLSSVLIFKYKISPPSLLLVILSHALVFFVLVGIFLVLGPVELFKIFHEVFFPLTDQWFFFYQDSLMTTLMMAPKLFGYFAIAWFGSAIPLCLALYGLVWVFLLKRVKEI